jgi:hypothetical protein
MKLVLKQTAATIKRITQHNVLTLFGKQKHQQNPNSLFERLSNYGDAN